MNKFGIRHFIAPLPHCLIAPLLLLQTTGSAAQTSLAGTWVATTDAPSGLTAAPSAILGPRFGIAEANGAITYHRVLRDLVTSTTFRLDGAEVRTVAPGPVCTGDSTSWETMAWEGDALVFAIRGVQSAGAPARTNFNARRLLRRTSPDTLTVEGTINQNGQARPVGTVYRRSSEAMAAPPKPIASTMPATIDAVKWIAGTWSAPAATPTALTTEERWTPPAGGAMQGMARETRGSALASFEFLCIVERAGSLTYQAMPGARSPATDFVLTAVSATEATFENPGHDYPKKIKYSLLADGSLQTEVSGAAGSRTTTVTLRRLSAQ